MGIESGGGFGADSGVVAIFGYGVKPSEMNKPRMCNIAHVLANKPKAWWQLSSYRGVQARFEPCTSTIQDVLPYH